MSQYSSKLRSPKWQQKRLEVFSAAGFACQSCEAQSKELHAHHTIYRKGKDPWEYDTSEIICLCADCHAIAESHKSSFNECLSTYIQASNGDSAIYGEFICLMEKYIDRMKK
jgi:hypothetical protein